MGNTWKDEARVDRLKRLWADGLSASQIANDLGHVTRNAVIGKVHRLGLSGRVLTRSQYTATRSSVARGTRKPRVFKSVGRTAFIMSPQKAALQKIMADAKPLPPPAATDVGRKTLLQLKDDKSECRFPVGDSSPQMFCADTAVPGLPYCEHHAWRCFAATQPTRVLLAREPVKPGPLKVVDPEFA